VAGTAIGVAGADDVASPIGPSVAGTGDGVAGADIVASPIGPSAVVVAGIGSGVDPSVAVNVGQGESAWFEKF
jgi:hypothetical protein